MEELDAYWATSISGQTLRRSVHEAGHAVVGRALGLSVRESVVVTDGANDENEGGHTTFDLPESGHPKIRQDDYFAKPIALDHPSPVKWWIATRAGGVAEVVGLAKSGMTVSYDDLMQDTLSDDAELRDALNQLTPQEQVAWYDQRYVETWALVGGLLSQILSTARELVAKSRIDGDDVDLVLATAQWQPPGDAGETLLRADNLDMGRHLMRQHDMDTWPSNRKFLENRARLIEKLLSGEGDPDHSGDACSS